MFHLVCAQNRKLNADLKLSTGLQRWARNVEEYFQHSGFLDCLMGNKCMSIDYLLGSVSQQPSLKIYYHLTVLANLEFGKYDQPTVKYADSLEMTYCDPMPFLYNILMTIPGNFMK